jgi:hypothetical protein
MLRNAGLVDVQVNPIVHVYPPGHSRRPLPLQFREGCDRSTRNVLIYFHVLP